MLAVVEVVDLVLLVAVLVVLVVLVVVEMVVLTETQPLLLEPLIQGVVVEALEILLATQTFQPLALVAPVL